MTSTASQAISIGGIPAINLTRPAQHQGEEPQFLSATVIPGKGMNVWQIRAYIPGKGDIDLLHADPLPIAQALLDQADNQGNFNFTQGGAFLLPYANRIRGNLSADGSLIETSIAGSKVSLPANWQGKAAGAEKHAMHGLMLNTPFTQIRQHEDEEMSRVIAELDAEDFAGHWLSKSSITAIIELREDSLEIVITVANIGEQPLPVGIGWHPYFQLPSGQRQQARLHMTAELRAEVNNYDDVFSTGKLEAVKNTPYDFNAPEGVALGDLYLDDCFTGLRSNMIEIIDPAAHYGLRIRTLSSEINAIQVYAPPDKNFIAIEPQFNLADPYNPAWGETDTGMVLLPTEKTVTWRLKLELFLP